MVEESRSNQLGNFLQARRAELRPSDVGLPGTGDRRRAAGLRREEVAALASISTDYYARIEQGRRSAPRATLETLARVLKIDEAGWDYLLELTRDIPVRPRRRQRQRASAPMMRLIDDLRSTPALLLGRRMDILGWNQLGASLLCTDLDDLGERERNYVRLTFDDRARDLYVNWAETAQLCVSMLHMELARDPDDPRLSELVGELSVRDEDFRRWWSGHQVADRGSGVKTFDHPLVGELTLEWHTLMSGTDTDQRLVLWSAAPGTPAHDQLLALVRATGPPDVSR